MVSTNLAESSITLDNVGYVIDFGLMKEIRFNSATGLERLDLAWASRASLRQRRGRTGRMCNGVNIKLISRGFFNELLEYATPEILRTPLEKMVLMLKKLAKINQDNPLYRRIFQNPLLFL